MSVALSTPATATEPVWDFDVLNKELDRTKADIFRPRPYAAFYAPLLCSLDFFWDESVGTACTNGSYIKWAPTYFNSLPRASRCTDLMHELRHVAKLHMIRGESKCPDIWNIACDIHIDLELEKEGYTFEGIKGVLTWPNLNARQYVGKAEEEIYDDLIKNGMKPMPQYVMDIQSPANGAAMNILGKIVTAIQQAKLGGHGAGQVPGDVETVITKFLAPVVPWELHLQKFMQEQIEDGYTWRRRNRRFASRMYMPSVSTDNGKLSALNYYEDVSGSISDADAMRFNSEFKYVKEVFRPDLMKLVQFDTKITQELVYKQEDPFDQVKIIGRGGTSLEPVRQHIIEDRPTAAIIFSDMCCEPMAPLPFEIPILWVVIRNRGAIVPFGKIIHIRN